MATKIRLARGGAKKSPHYRIVVSDARSPRDGKFIEKLGTYSPLLAKDNAGRVTVEKERVEYWLSTGAQPSDRVAKLLVGIGFSQVKLPVKKSSKPAGEKKKKTA